MEVVIDDATDHVRYFFDHLLALDRQVALDDGPGVLTSFLEGEGGQLLRGLADGLNVLLDLGQELFVFGELVNKRGELVLL